MLPLLPESQVSRRRNEFIVTATVANMQTGWSPSFSVVSLPLRHVLLLILPLLIRLLLILLLLPPLRLLIRLPKRKTLLVGGQPYSPSVGLGACGSLNSDEDLVCAMDYVFFDNFDDYQGTNPNNNPICNKKVRIYHGDNSVEVTVKDKCPGCNGMHNIDMSTHAFQLLADLGLGNISIEWHFVT